MSKRRGVKRDSYNSLEAVKEGFLRFYKENGHFPTASEIDDFPYLCSARWIQMRFGGLNKFRQDIGLDIKDYRTGETRTNMCRTINRLSIETENSIKKFLIRHIPSSSGTNNNHMQNKYLSSAISSSCFPNVF